MAVPTVDFSKFSASSDLEAKEAAYQLVQSLRKHGFVKLVNHGIPREVTQAFFTQVPFSDHHQYKHEETERQP